MYVLKHYKESSAWNALYSWHTEDTQQVLGIIIFSFKGICNFIYILFPATFGETIQKLAPKIIHAIKTNILAQYMYTESQNQSKQIFLGIIIHVNDIIIYQKMHHYIYCTFLLILSVKGKISSTGNQTLQKEKI